MEAILPIIVQLWPVVFVPLIGLGMKWLGSWLNAKTEGLGIANTTAVIEYLQKAVTVVVENIGSAIVDKVRLAAADGVITDEEKAEIFKTAHDVAIAELKKQVPATYQEVLQKAIDSGLIDTMIAYAVNMRTKKAEGDVQYERDTVAKEIARYKAEHPAQ